MSETDVLIVTWVAALVAPLGFLASTSGRWPGGAEAVVRGFPPKRARLFEASALPFTDRVFR